MADKIVEAAPAVEVDDIQATVLHPRPSPYKGEESQHPFVELVERQRLFFHSFPGSSPGAVRAIRLLNILDFPVIDCEPSTSVVSRVE